MQFRHPELLYALFLLLIPILIHLFQLRRFKKTQFTNVAFLKKVTMQTRKSSQIKKWLTLFLRLLAIACLVIAFAQPFTAKKTALNTAKETVVYLDNSFSMQAKGGEGTLLERAKQELYKLPVSQKISWFTNNSSKSDVTAKNFSSEILKVDYANNQLTPNEVLLKASQLFSNSNEVEKRLIYISDFQQKERFPSVIDGIIVDAVQVVATSKNNISIDTLYIVENNTNKLIIKTEASSQEKTNQPVAISLYNGNELIAKTALDFSDNQKAATTFEINTNSQFLGKLTIEDPNIVYDNSLYFSINTGAKIKTLSINDGNSDYLKRIFTPLEFEYTAQSSTNLDYNLIPSQNFVILNNLKEIPAPLSSALVAFSKNGGSIVIIPSETINISSYNSLLSSLNLGSFGELIATEKQITTIIFDHPLYKNVFEKQVLNFQYPKVNSYYTYTSNSSTALAFEDSKPFVTQRNNASLFTGAITNENSNFINSPLVVPTLYNMAKQSLPLPKLYYNIGVTNEIAIPISLTKDEIVTIKDTISSTIPLQKSNANKVTLTIEDDPDRAGNYSLEKNKELLQTISFNNHREESKLQYLNLDTWKGVTTHKSIDQLFEKITNDNTITNFWKWFAILAFIFLLLEMLVLKFYKK